MDAVKEPAEPPEKKKEDKKDGGGGHKAEIFDVEQTMKDLSCSSDGLTDAEVDERREKYGYNALPQKEVWLILEFLKFFNNPLSWAMEVAAIVAICLLDYFDFSLITALLFFNALIGFVEEQKAGNALKALEAGLSLKADVYRNGELVHDLDATLLVPGDIINLRLGNIVPADCICLKGTGLKIDQAALTGESLPVGKVKGSKCYSGSAVKHGENKALVTETGSNTFIGKAALFVAEDKGLGHFQRVLWKVGFFCIGSILIWVIIVLAVQLGGRKSPCTAINKCPAVENILVFIVGGIPIAMPIVLQITMAIGAEILANKHSCLVKRFTAIEELAGMDVLCSDKTGTLTKNKLEVYEDKIIMYDESVAKDDVLLYAALASNLSSKDAIDFAMKACLSDKKKGELDTYQQVHFHPFDPEDKVAWAKVQAPDGTIFHTLKGAPQIVCSKSTNRDKIGSRVKRHMEKLGSNGYRCIGLAVSDDQGKDYRMVALIPLLDPPRDDTAETIKKATKMGISVRMITGDQTAIAKETCRQLQINDNILPADVLANDGAACMENYNVPLEEIIEGAGGFAMVMPEHKYQIVKSLQTGKHKHTVGMTGDGVNDAPALKRADIGIAVADATAAAAAAADIVLQAEGLSAIIHAITASRKIFQRMKNYCMYSISVCVRVVLTFGIYTVVYGRTFPPEAMVMLACFNDLSMLSVSTDRVKANDEPDVWDLREIFGVSIFIGSYLAISTHILWIVIFYTGFFEDHLGLNRLNFHTINGFIYLQVSISGLAVIFVTRTKWFSWTSRPSTLLLCMFCFAQMVASLIGGFGFPGIPSECTPRVCLDIPDYNNFLNANNEIGVLPVGWGGDYSLPMPTESPVPRLPYFRMPSRLQLDFCVNSGWDFDSLDNIYYRKEVTYEDGYLEIRCDKDNSDVLPGLGGCGAAYVLVAWIWCAGWHLPLDFIKIASRWLLKGGITLGPHGPVIRKRPGNVKKVPLADQERPVFHSRLSLEIMERKAKGELTESTSSDSLSLKASI